MNQTKYYHIWRERTVRRGRRVEVIRDRLAKPILGEAQAELQKACLEAEHPEWHWHLKPAFSASSAVQARDEADEDALTLPLAA